MDGTKQTKALKITACIFLLAALGLGVFRIFLLAEYVDADNGLYSNRLLGTVFNSVLWGLLAVNIATYFFTKKAAFDRPIRNEALSVAFAASVCALMMAAVFFVNIVDMATGKRTFSLFLGAETVLCVPSILYFFTVCSRGAKQEKDAASAYSLLPLFPALYTAIRIIALFINTETQINASERSFSLLAMVFIMMFFVTEAEFSVSLSPSDDDNDKENKEKKENTDPAAQAARLAKTKASLTAKYLVYALVVVTLTVAILLPSAFASAFLTYDRAGILYRMMDLCIGLYALMRLFTAR